MYIMHPIKKLNFFFWKFNFTYSASYFVVPTFDILTYDDV